MTKLQELENKLNPPRKKLGQIAYNKSGVSLPIGLPDIERYKIIRENEPDLAVVAARPGVGKTSFLLQTLMEIGKQGPTIMFSLEMPSPAIQQRADSMVSGYSVDQLHKINDSSRNLISKHWEDTNLFIEDKNGYTLNEIINVCHGYAKDHKLKAIGIDYMQIISVPLGRTKAEEVALVAQKLKELAKELHIPIIALVQMNRNIEGRKAATGGKGRIEPLMSDLADSAGIERWADSVTFLYKPGQDRPNEIDVYIVKNRNGPSGYLTLGFTPEITKFHHLEENCL